MVARERSTPEDEEREALRRHLACPWPPKATPGNVVWLDPRRSLVRGLLIGLPLSAALWGGVFLAIRWLAEHLPFR